MEAIAEYKGAKLTAFGSRSKGITDRRRFRGESRRAGYGRGQQVADHNYVKERFYFIQLGEDGLLHDLYLPIKKGSEQIYIDDGASSASTILQIQSGEIAGYMAADIALTETKRSLDDLTKSLVAEFNEVHRFGVDLKGVQGKDFFSLDAIEINKMSIRESTAQLRVDGNLESSMGDNFSVKYSGSEDLWLIADQSGKKLKEFKGSTELNGLRFNVEGKPALGDSFTVKITNNASENLQIKIKDGNDIAASSFYFIEPAGSNAGNGEISLERFAEIKNDNLKSGEQRNLRSKENHNNNFNQTHRRFSSNYSTNDNHSNSSKNIQINLKDKKDIFKVLGITWGLLIVGFFLAKLGI